MLRVLGAGQALRMAPPAFLDERITPSTDSPGISPPSLGLISYLSLPFSSLSPTRTLSSCLGSPMANNTNTASRCPAVMTKSQAFSYWLRSNDEKDSRGRGSALQVARQKGCIKGVEMVEMFGLCLVWKIHHDPSELWRPT